MHVEDVERPVGAWLLACRLLRDRGETSSRQLALAMKRASDGLYGKNNTHVIALCRRLEETGVVEMRPARTGRRNAFLWKLTKTGREWLAEELARAAALLGFSPLPSN